MSKKNKACFESVIGRIIYACMLFAPLGAIATTSLYSIFNPNAKDSYSDNLIESYNKINSNTQYQINNTYQVIYDETKTTGTTGTFGVAENNLDQFLQPNETREIKSFTIINENYPRINITFTNNETYRVDNWNEISKTFYFVLRTQPSTSYINDFKYMNIYLITRQTQKLDNAFYYSIDKVEENKLFNWASNTALYSGLSDTCELLGITNTFTPFILSYWMLTSIIYVIYDIALIMVNMAHKKVHELVEF